MEKQELRYPPHRSKESNPSHCSQLHFDSALRVLSGLARSQRQDDRSLPTCGRPSDKRGRWALNHHAQRNRDGIEKLLIADGYRVALARDEGDAIESVQRTRPDLILVLAPNSGVGFV